MTGVLGHLGPRLLALALLIAIPVRAGAQPMPLQPPEAPASTPLPPLHAAPRANAPPPEMVERTLTIDAGNGRIVALRAPAANVFAADPKVAQVRPASPTSLFIFGVAPGRTTVAALDTAGHAIAQYEVVVQPSAYGADAASAALARLFPGRGLRTEIMGKTLILEGDVATPDEAEQAQSVARAYLPPGDTLENRLNVAASVQVGLKVRITEMTRAVVREIGVNWQNLSNPNPLTPGLGYIGRFSTVFTSAAALSSPPFTPGALAGAYNNGHGFSIDGLIDALAQDNLVRTLAEPNLTARSGESASFLVGGEYPIPIAQAFGQTTVQFQQYGVQLSFVPTVLSSGRISLHVRPEVSELTNQGAVQLTTGNNSIAVPALLVRRADTTIELGSGQSFAIAGLLQDQTNQLDNSVLGLGEIPILGALFRSESFQRNETELVIIVTPYIVRPVDNPAALHTPSEGYRVPNDIERILLMRQMGKTTPTVAAHVPGDAGFIVQ